MIKIAGVCILGCIMCVLLRQCGRGEMALLTAAAVGLYVFSVSAEYVAGIVTVLEQLAETTGLNTGVFKTIIKITGIAYISQTASELCRDSGEGALAGKVELYGKILICATAIPAVKALFSIVSDFL